MARKRAAVASWMASPSHCAIILTRELADLGLGVNRSLAEGEFTASRFRLQDLPDGDLSLNVDTSDGPTLGRSFAIYFNQTRVGRLEISPRYDYRSDIPKVYTNVEIDWGRFFSALTDASYTGPVCVEVEDRAYEGPLVRRKESLRQAHTFLRNYISPELSH